MIEPMPWYIMGLLAIACILSGYELFQIIADCEPA